MQDKTEKTQETKRVDKTSSPDFSKTLCQPWEWQRRILALTDHMYFQLNMWSCQISHMTGLQLTFNMTK